MILELNNKSCKKGVFLSETILLVEKFLTFSYKKLFKTSFSSKKHLLKFLRKQLNILKN